jgi:hypothetical protein
VTGHAVSRDPARCSHPATDALAAPLPGDIANFHVSATVRELVGSRTAVSGSHAATRRAGFCMSAAWVDPTLQHKNRAGVLVDGPEIIVRPVGARQV